MYNNLRTITKLPGNENLGVGLRTPGLLRQEVDISPFLSWYLLDNNAIDVLGNNDGIASNMSWVATSKGYSHKIGSFNGSTSNVNTNISNFSSYNNTGFVFHFNTTTTSTTQSIVGSDLALRVLVDSGNLVVQNRPAGGGWNSIQTAISANTDYFGMVTFETNGDMILYLNNEQKASTSVTTKENSDTYGIYIGVNNRTSQSLHFSGTIGLVGVLKEIPSARFREQIYLHYLQLLH